MLVRRLFGKVFIRARPSGLQLSLFHCFMSRLGAFLALPYRLKKMDESFMFVSASAIQFDVLLESTNQRMP